MRFARFVWALPALVFAAPAACSDEPEVIYVRLGNDGGAAADTGVAVTPEGGAGDTGAPCTKAADCPSKVCNAGTCAPASATDGIQNGSETDIDCGGAGNPPCDTGRKCAKGPDCKSGVCTGNVCQAPTSSDGVKNGDETDIDCGGAGNPKCDAGKACLKKDDCKSDVCTGGKCALPATANGIKDGTETDIDCGGPAAPRCGDLLSCIIDGDCKSDVCKDLGTGPKCQPPTPLDGKKNGDETDVDCGGAGNPPCAVGKSCLVADDCIKNACSYAKKCVAAKSCVGHFGGDTCGLGGLGGRGPQTWESCCVGIPVTTAGTTVQLDKYQVTAGRFRVFLTAIAGNVRGFINNARLDGAVPTVPATTTSVMRPEWDRYLPVSMAGNNDAPPGEIADPDNETVTPINGIYTGVHRHVGGKVFMQNSHAEFTADCMVKNGGSPAYFLPAAVRVGFGDIAHEQTQDVNDTKAMTCVDYLLAQAFCIWDGGRLETLAEWQQAIGGLTYPWAATPAPKQQDPLAPAGFQWPAADDAFLRNPANGAPAGYVPTAAQTIEYGNYSTYQFPALVLKDNIVRVNAPGRMTGRGVLDHADLLGNVLELTSTITTNVLPATARSRVTGNGHWDNINAPPAPATYTRSPSFSVGLLNKTGFIGFRCVRF